jgi:hypothetical protein
MKKLFIILSALFLTSCEIVLDITNRSDEPIIVVSKESTVKNFQVVINQIRYDIDTYSTNDYSIRLLINDLKELVNSFEKDVNEFLKTSYYSIDEYEKDLEELKNTCDNLVYNNEQIKYLLGEEQ